VRHCGVTCEPAAPSDLERSAADEVAHERVWRPGQAVPVHLTLGVLRRGAGDPSYRHDPLTGTVWRAMAAPTGPVTLRLRPRPTAGEVVATAWGPGAAWALDMVPAMLGAGDDVDGFVPHHDIVAQAWRRMPGWRVCRTGLVIEALAPAAVEQLVTGQEAFASWRRLVRRFGTPAPGAGAALRMVVPPTARTWAALPSWEWLRGGVDGKRSATVVRACKVAGRLEATLDLPHEEAERRLRAVPGVGVWTAAEVRQRAHGDPDAVSFGDYHVAKDVGWALIGRPVDDDGLAELLEPYRGHRYRVQRLLQLAGVQRPRRGARMAPRTHLPVRR
jgi:3-methyladenine DNA glycosylase/8-oxoguanine DNA glycosylase